MTVFPYLFFGLFFLMLAVILAGRRKGAARTLVAEEPIAPDEWYRVRRTWASITPTARVWGVVSAGGCVVVAMVGAYATIASTGLDEFLFAFVIVGCGFLVFPNLLGLTPEFVYDALATSREIRITSLIRTAVFERDHSTADLRETRNTLVPFKLVLCSRGRKRVIPLDGEGARTLKALGWIKNEDSP